MRTLGKYQVRGLLGRGASATVYKARLPAVDRLVAVKVLTPDETLLALLGEAELRARFTAEARLLAAIEHPRLAAVLDYDTDSRGRPFYVMDYFCQNLGALLGETYEADRPSRTVPVERAVRYGLQILEGLTRLHDAGYLHRDVKPFNVMLDAEDQVKLIDLGLSTLRGEVRPGPKNLKVGTPFYGAPEQEADPAGADERADLYGLGVTLWRMLAGRLPAETHAERRPASRDNPLLDEAFDAFLCRAVHPDRNERFPSARDMARELAALFAGWQARLANACRLAETPAPAGSPAIRRLRSAPLKVRVRDAAHTFPTDNLGRPLTVLRHPLEARDETVLDPASRLLWQRGGSAWPLSRPEAESYVAGLNTARFAGRSDWRLPTVDELLSVLRPGTGPDLADWCAEPALDPSQRWLWSADRATFTSAWYADTRLGFVAAQDCDCRLHARAVASARGGVMPCRRCGTCCAKGGPALHGADAPLVAGGIIRPDRLVTLRAGEPAVDQLRERVLPLASEIIKIRGPRGLVGCVFHLGEAGCAIYRNRPLECRLLDCEDPAPLAAVYAADRLSRADILGSDHPLMELVRHFEALCPAGEAFRLAREPGPAARGALAGLLSADRALRGAFLDKTGAAPELADFLFGRSLPEILAPLGLHLPA